MTPSFFAPRASMARWDVKLKLSVRSPTTLHPRVSNACAKSSSLQAVLTLVRCTRSLARTNLARVRCIRAVGGRAGAGARQSAEDDLPRGVGYATCRHPDASPALPKIALGKQDYSPRRCPGEAQPRQPHPFDH